MCMCVCVCVCGVCVCVCVCVFAYRWCLADGTLRPILTLFVILFTANIGAKKSKLICHYPLRSNCRHRRPCMSYPCNPPCVTAPAYPICEHHRPNSFYTPPSRQSSAGGPCLSVYGPCLCALTHESVLCGTSACSTKERQRMTKYCFAKG